MGIGGTATARGGPPLGPARGVAAMVAKGATADGTGRSTRSARSRFNIYADGPCVGVVLKEWTNMNSWYTDSRACKCAQISDCGAGQLWHLQGPRTLRRTAILHQQRDVPLYAREPLHSPQSRPGALFSFRRVSSTQRPHMLKVLRAPQLAPSPKTGPKGNCSLPAWGCRLHEPHCAIQRLLGLTAAEQAAHVRGSAALGTTDLLPIDATGQPCSKFGVHKKLPVVKQPTRMARGLRCQHWWPRGARHQG